MRTPQAIAESPIPEIVKALFESSAWAAEGNLPLYRMHHLLAVFRALVYGLFIRILFLAFSCEIYILYYFALF